MTTTIHRGTRVAAALALAAVVVIPNAGRASSDRAWASFRADVAQACRQAADGILRAEHTTIDPWGSAHYGLARLVGTVPGEHAPRQVLCVYDKRSHAVEIGSPMPINSAVRTEAP
ncbi:hypothetical protein [Salinisphaera hydrothermalis]|uniref:hypothetical protein n=1 Tax=Salinisphaera hydrothermalis TaxID=563188 RepID=UPI00333EEE2B